MMEQTAQDINKLGGFCGKRDLPALTQAAMRQAYGCPQAEVVAQGSQLTYREAIPGMWTVDRYVNLLMGEIPRLTDNAAGYGPNGKNYITHDDIPPEVQAAFERLQAVYGTQTRAANPLYASK